MEYPREWRHLNRPRLIFSKNFARELVPNGTACHIPLISWCSMNSNELGATVVSAITLKGQKIKAAGQITYTDIYLGASYVWYMSRKRTTWREFGPPILDNYRKICAIEVHEVALKLGWRGPLTMLQGGQLSSPTQGHIVLCSIYGLHIHTNSLNLFCH